MPTSLGPAEIMVILIVALIVLGPKRLPEAGRQVGKAIAEVRKWSQSFQDEIKGVVDPVVKAPSYSDPQPGYQPPIPVIPAETAVATAPPADVATPIPVIPAETAPPSDVATPIPVIPAETAPPSDVATAPPSDVATAPPSDVATAPPSEVGAESDGTGTVTTTGSHGEVSGTVPADTSPSAPSESPAGEPPRT